MNNPGLIKSLVAETAITKKRFVKFGSTNDYVVQAAAATDAIIGVSAEIDADAGERIDIIIDGIAEVEFGGNVTRGASFLTADSDGKAVAAAPAAGVTNRVGGIAMESGVDGDIGSVDLTAKGAFQGAGLA